jgi:hypothetical protein
MSLSYGIALAELFKYSGDAKLEPSLQLRGIWAYGQTTQGVLKVCIHCWRQLVA